MTAQPLPQINIDVRPARKSVRRLAAVTRDVLVELARLDEALAQLEGREAALAHYGIRLEVEPYE